MPAAERASMVAQSMTGAGKAREQTRGAQRLVVTRGPDLVANGRGDVVGVELWVELWVDGEKEKIDPHRRFINPPTQIVTAPQVVGEDGQVLEPRQSRSAPEEAIWSVLWDSVLEHPRATRANRRRELTPRQAAAERDALR